MWDQWFITLVAACCLCFFCFAAASSIIALSNNRPLFQVRGCCWDTDESSAASLALAEYSGDPPLPFLFFLRMHHLLTWQCVAIPSTTVSHLGQHPPSAFTAVHRQSNQSEPVLSSAEEGCDFQHGALLNFKSPVCTKGITRGWRRGGGGGGGEAGQPFSRQQRISLSCGEKERRMQT